MEFRNRPGGRAICVWRVKEPRSSSGTSTSWNYRQRASGPRLGQQKPKEERSSPGQGDDGRAIVPAGIEVSRESCGKASGQVLRGVGDPRGGLVLVIADCLGKWRVDCGVVLGSLDSWGKRRRQADGARHRIGLIRWRNSAACRRERQCGYRRRLRGRP